MFWAAKLLGESRAQGWALQYSESTWHHPLTGLGAESISCDVGHVV